MTPRLLLAVWQYRSFIASSVRREFRARYRNSLLGGLWAVINPLASVVIYLVIFAEVMRARLPGATDSMSYGIFLCTGVLSWGLFSEIISRSLTVFLDHSNLIKKISFPRICLPVIVLLNAGISFAIIFTLFLLLLIATGNFPGFLLLAFLPLLLIQCVFALGLGILVGTLNVFFRDAGQFVTVGLQFWFWFTPIVYPTAILSESIARLVQANPMTPLIMAQQAIMVEQRPPDWASLAAPAVTAFVLAFLALALFRRHSYEIVDEL